ncbi:MAG: arginine--tRNA ligase [Elusimicrobia bacterium]|nr:arginine--tRNA ligase [Elusimicrobiota bacterium]
MIDFLKKIIARTIADKFGAEIPFDIMKAPAFTNCDYASNIASKLSEGEAEILRAELSRTPYFDEVRFQKPFVNFRVKMDFLKKFFLDAISDKKPENDKKEKILIEFISANPTGLLHIGHIRGGVLGDVLAKILKELGWNVIREYYVNDRGRQIKLLAESVIARSRGKKPPEDGYDSEIIGKIADEIKPGLDEKEIAKLAIGKILSEIKKDLELAKINFDSFFSESRLYETKKVDEVLKILRKKKSVFEKDGAIWLETEGCDEKDRVLVKKDGEPTYFLSDISYHAEKFKRADRLINIWGADHHGYVGRIKKSVALLGKNPDKLKVILYQLVRLKRGKEIVKMSKRGGSILLARDVLKEVGKDAARFFLLSRKADAQLDFDLELAKEKSQKNPVYYIQYVHARICSVFEKAKSKNIAMAERTELLSEAEREILKTVCEFDGILNLCAREFAPHHLVNYLLDLSKTFHNYYERNRIISEDKELSGERLFLIYGVRKIIKKSLGLLGISAPEKM